MASFLEILDPLTGKKKKRTIAETVPTQREIQQRIQKIAPNPTRNQTLVYDARPHQMGAPRVQGFHGANQGAWGFLGSLVKQNNAIAKGALEGINAQPKYEKPSFGDASPLSNEWFNTALKRIAVRNRQKMDMARMNALARVLPSFLGQSNVAMNTMADMQKASMINASKAQELAEQKRWHDMMNNYYQGLLGQKQQKAGVDPYKEDKIKIERWKLLQRNPIDVIPYWDDLDEAQKMQVAKYFTDTGRLPTIRKNPKAGLFSDEPEYIVEIQQEQAPMQEPMQPAPDSRTTKAMKILDERIAPDGKYFVKLADGKWYEFE